MIFGEFPPQQCKDSILAHTLKLPQKTIKKGSILSNTELELIAQANIEKIWVAKLEENDLHENEAATNLANALCNEQCIADVAFTGRVNLFSTISGIFCPNIDIINSFNRIDPAITLATLQSFTSVPTNKMVATVKIIPFAVNNQLVQNALELLDTNKTVLEIAPYKSHKIGVISTLLPSLKESVINKTIKTLELRLKGTNSTIDWDLRIPHTIDDLAKNIAFLRDQNADLIVIFGASAITDKADVIPVAIEKSGGMVRHFGLPVDPGNLLLLAELNDTKIIGAPGCARSPKENGFDWVLHRTLAGIEIESSMLTGLGVGGLLMDIMSRPVPRQGSEKNIENPKVAAIVLAAGKSSRMGETNKLLAKINEKPLVRISVESVLNSKVDSVTVVTGHMAEDISKTLSGLNINILKNESYKAGLSTSLAMGIQSLPTDVDAVLIVLADMPFIETHLIDKILNAYNPALGDFIIVPTAEGKRGNPVLWSRRYFDELCQIEGDIGARALIESNSESVLEVELGESARLDVDTPEQLKRLGGLPHN